MALQRVLLLFMASAIFVVATHANIAVKDSTQRSNIHQQQQQQEQQQQQQRKTNLFTKHTYHPEPTYPPIFIEVLQQRYFLLEDAMWNVIASGLEQSYVLDQIHKGHQSFFLGNFTVHNCYLSTFDPHQSVIYDAMNAINRSTVETIDRYLQTSAYSFGERDALALSVRNQNLTYQLDVLFNKMMDSDFLTIVRNVSVHFFVAILRSLASLLGSRKNAGLERSASIIRFTIRFCFDVRMFVFVCVCKGICVIHGHRFDNMDGRGLKATLICFACPWIEQQMLHLFFSHLH